ncbi:MAG: NAD(P)/FAD-dependent oxidoreductase [Thermoplasmata archaeon]|nr:NAD(P)/FAD-dependent oxidoreductase [Thermoplasmata archaeon]
MVRDVVIVGAGPAGISAAVYLQRIGHEPLVFEKDKVGGLLLNANLVENYPGFPEGIGGTQLVGLFNKHLEKQGVEIKHSEVTEVKQEKGHFVVATPDGDVEARIVLITTGTRPKEAGIPGENELNGTRLFYEVREILEKDGKDFVIIGGGDAAFDYALNLSKGAGKVDIVCRSSNPSCISLLEERVQQATNINFHKETSSESLSEVGGKVKLSCKTPEGEKEFDADYALIACGRESRWLDVKGLESVSSIGNMTRTTVPGLFVAGDVKQGDHRQVGIAVGDGVQAAMSIADYLERGEEE